MIPQPAASKPQTSPTPLRLITPAEFGETTGTRAVVLVETTVLISIAPRTPAEAAEINKNLQAAGFGN